MLEFVLLVNKQGQTRVSKYYNQWKPVQSRVEFETEIVRKCLLRSEGQCSFLEHQASKIVYRRYASLFIIVGVDQEENELAVYEFIHNIVETLDKYFQNVCELDIMFNLEKAHFILDEMVLNGCIMEGNQNEVLLSLAQLDGETSRGK
eukprot:TRINITY_DN4804_c0_g1_i1.p1 TRINITY_DN4804_c0_g1~~TRINITY_DN4804_c0_g1_i1.p1  ORF type:complete len:148 (-),score=24.58 TRINITY_DN4804_c0_g1_i1:49-492(-)